MNRYMQWFSILALAAFMGGCGATHHQPHWSYEGETAPKYWGELAAEYGTCQSGVEQSPIDLKVTKASTDVELTMEYKPSSVDVINNGHTVKFNYDEGSTLHVDGKAYELLQFHFHSPSEHTVNAGHFPIEFHLVHQSDDGELAVIGVMVKPGRTNKAFEAVIENLPYQDGETISKDGASIDMSALLPKHTERFFHYRGSLTTPPCSESVQWFVLKEPIRLDNDQITAFSRIYHGNNRPVNPLGERTLFQGE